LSESVSGQAVGKSEKDYMDIGSTRLAQESGAFTRRALRPESNKNIQILVVDILFWIYYIEKLHENDLKEYRHAQAIHVILHLFDVVLHHCRKMQ
jgi:hypothetical protein